MRCEAITQMCVLFHYNYDSLLIQDKVNLNKKDQSYYCNELNLIYSADKVNLNKKSVQPYDCNELMGVQP